MNTNAHKVVIAENGPYLVSGSVPLAVQVIAPNTEGLSWDWVQGRSFQAEASYALCRCGASATKPFCDGSHAKVGFDGTETASRETVARQAETYDGPTLTLRDAESLCAFARFCDAGGKIWSLIEKTDDPAARALVIREANHCPAGRLVVHDKNTHKAIEEPLPSGSADESRDPRRCQRAGNCAPAGTEVGPTMSRSTNSPTIVAPRAWQRLCGTCRPCAATHGRDEERTGIMQDTQVKDAVDQVRSATQQLHKAISDAAAKRGGAAKADLEAVPMKAKAAIDSIKSSVATQNAAAKKHLTEAVTFLEATRTHAAEGVKTSGKEFQTAVRQTIADARAAVQQVSEAVAAKRTAGATASAKK